MVANAFGEKYEGSRQDFSDFIKGNFYKCLQALEVIYEYAKERDDLDSAYDDSSTFSQSIEYTLSLAEIDLGISWRKGRFYPSGAKELDEALVNQPLEWLRNKGYDNVLTPYVKALDHLLHSKQKPELLSDVITDLYESLEALAKIVTRKDKDLSANRQSFLKEVQASESYKSILKEYINYANKFRHAAREGTGKPELSYKETESFLYLTGLFIRMVMD